MIIHERRRAQGVQVTCANRLAGYTEAIKLSLGMNNLSYDPTRLECVAGIVSIRGPSNEHGRNRLIRFN